MRFIGIMCVLLLVAIGLGYFLGWIHFSSQRETGDHNKTTASVEVDTGRIQDDTAAAKDKAEKIGESLKERVEAVTGIETAKGKIVRVEAASNSFQVVIGDHKELTIHVESGTKVYLNKKKVQLQDLHEGDPVSVTYKAKAGTNMARTVTVEHAG